MFIKENSSKIFIFGKTNTYCKITSIYSQTNKYTNDEYDHCL